MTKTTVELPDTLVAEAKAVARDRGLTLRELIEAGLRQQLQLASEPPGAYRLDWPVGGSGRALELERPPHTYAYDAGRGGRE